MSPSGPPNVSDFHAREAAWRVSRGFGRGPKCEAGRAHGVALPRNLNVQVTQKTELSPKCDILSLKMLAVDPTFDTRLTSTGRPAGSLPREGGVAGQGGQVPRSGVFLLKGWPDIYRTLWSCSSSANLSCVDGVYVFISCVSGATSERWPCPACLGHVAGPTQSEGSAAGLGRRVQTAGGGPGGWAGGFRTSHLRCCTQPALPGLPEVPELQNILRESLCS